MTGKATEDKFSRFFGSTCTVPSKWGELHIESASFTDAIDGDLVVVLGDALKSPSPLVRIHSECVFAEAFGSLLCDCADQLHIALSRIQEEGAGILFYLRLDGRGAGLSAKVAATDLEMRGADTFDSRVEIGVLPDGRDFSPVARYLHDQGIASVRLLTNNPSKASDLREHVPNVDIESLRVEHPNEFVAGLYSTKRERFRHHL